MCKLAVIDDNPLDHFIIQKIIDNNHLFPETLHVSDGREVIQLFSQTEHNTTHLPDVILLDLNMPLYSGWDFLQQMSRIYCSIKKRIDIYIVSSSIDMNDKARTANFPFVKDFISKPVKKETLLSLYKIYQ